MSAAARRKGRDAENEVRKLWAAAGWEVTASQRNLGGGQGDALVRLNGRTLHVESKRQETLAVPAWLRQAKAEASPGVPPVVCFRQNRDEWYAVLSLSDLLEMIS